MAASRATSAWSGARWHTGSVAVASPVSAKAWQRQPPKSSSRRGQLAHGSFIHAVPRKALKAGEFAQISARESTSRVTGQHLARRCHVEGAAAPAADAWLWIPGVVVG